MSREPDRRRLSRRDFVRLTGVSASVLATGGLSLLAGCSADEPLAPEAGAHFAKGGKGGGGKPRPTTRNPLKLPSTSSPSLTLNAGPAVADLGGGNTSNVWAYNGQFPGPTIEAWRGDLASIQLENGLADETITHWHGMIVDDVNDGHPRHAIQPGERYSYNFTVDQRACLNWYHPHPHELTGEQVNMGLAGAFIIRDNEENALGLPSGAYEIPLIIRDAKLDKNGNLQYQPKRGGFDGNLALINGTRDSGLEVDTALYRFRILNGANARIFRLALDSGASFTLIGNDGGLLETSGQIAQIDISPAERLDVLIDFRGLSVGDRVMLRDLRSGWDLLEFSVTRNVNDSGSIPAGLSTIPQLSNPVRTREFSFDGMSRINGRVYALNRIDVQVPFGETERWIFTTNGNAPHPVHVHAAPFQVQNRTGGRGQVFPWERGWKDTVLLEDGETVEVLVRFDVHRGIYLMHCHKLEHEDMGMMLNFEVV